MLLFLVILTTAPARASDAPHLYDGALLQAVVDVRDARRICQNRLADDARYRGLIEQVNDCDEELKRRRARRADKKSIERAFVAYRLALLEVRGEERDAMARDASVAAATMRLAAAQRAFDQSRAGATRPSSQRRPIVVTEAGLSVQELKKKYGNPSFILEQDDEVFVWETLPAGAAATMPVSRPAATNPARVLPWLVIWVRDGKVTRVVESRGG
jgi:hypothetical protein